jgi:hypothetical protein
MPTEQNIQPPDMKQQIRDMIASQVPNPMEGPSLGGSVFTLMEGYLECRKSRTASCLSFW